MHESDFQSAVSNAILNRQTEGLTAGLTDNEMAVIIEAGGHNAAFTADEARDLANGIESESTQKWDENTEAIVAYLRDLADIVDGDKAVEEVKHLWKDRDLNPDYDNRYE
jgi:hypothetical protein